MPPKIQYTRLHRNFGLLIERLDSWALNPWRHFSLVVIVFLSAFFLGSSLGMINGVLALMDPVGAFFTVLLLEFMVRIRRQWITLSNSSSITLQLLDALRIGLVYGLLMEGFKLF